MLYHKQLAWPTGMDAVSFGVLGMTSTPESHQQQTPAAKFTQTISVDERKEKLSTMLKP